PKIACEPPANLHPRKIIEWLESTEAGQSLFIPQDELPKAKIALAEELDLTFNEFNDFFIRPNCSGGDVFHDQRVAGNGFEGNPISGNPWKQQKSFSFKSMGRH